MRFEEVWTRIFRNNGSIESQRNDGLLLSNGLSKLFRNIARHLSEMIKLLGDFELQALVITFLLKVLRISQKFGLCIDIRDCALKIAFSSTKTWCASDVRLVLNSINSKNDSSVKSIEAKGLFFDGNHYSASTSANGIWIDFNLKSITTNLMGQEDPSLFLLEISYSSIRTWTAMNSLFLRLDLGHNKPEVCIEFEHFAGIASAIRAVDSHLKIAKKISRTQRHLYEGSSGPLDYSNSNSPQTVPKTGHSEPPPISEESSASTIYIKGEPENVFEMDNKLRILADASLACPTHESKWPADLLMDLLLSPSLLELQKCLSDCTLKWDMKITKMVSKFKRKLLTRRIRHISRLKPALDNLPTIPELNEPALTDKVTEMKEVLTSSFDSFRFPAFNIKTSIHLD